LVTGGSRGIGAMIVQGLLEHGCSRVYITARKAVQCDAAAKELSLYGECISIPGDVSTQAGIEALATEIAKREDKLDILVNNAGAAWGAAFDEYPESGWDKTVDLNL
jgi:NAD(P)-dependent dehydrogenase (short-subunit alcohol dehydrogenase family)